MSLSVVRPCVLAIGVLAAVLAGCSSETPSEDPAPTSTDPSTTAPTTSEHGSYAHCLSEHGITTPPAGPGTPPGVDEDTWRTAQEACASLAPGPASQ